MVRNSESAGVLIFALVTSKVVNESFTIQVCTRELSDTGSGSGAGSGAGPILDGFATGQLCHEATHIIQS